jgi:uncharacterized protein (TIGR02271 family)
MNNEKEELRYSENFQNSEGEKSATVTVPIIEEEVKVSKKFVETGRVTLSKKVNESTESFEVPVTEEEISVERITKNELITETPPASRYEGDVMIIPVLKEVVVIEKRMMLVEEIRVTKKVTQKTEKQEVTVRKEEVTVSRNDK